jgi:hypothetical protein
MQVDNHWEFLKSGIIEVAKATSGYEHKENRGE